MGVVLDVRLAGPLATADLARACLCLAWRLRSGNVTTVVCHTEALAGELAAVEALARLSLVARRGGARFAVRGMSSDLISLVDLLGLAEPIAAYDGADPAVPRSRARGGCDGGGFLRTVSRQAHSDRRGDVR